MGCGARSPVGIHWLEIPSASQLGPVHPSLAEFDPVCLNSDQFNPVHPSSVHCIPASPITPQCIPDQPSSTQCIPDQPSSAQCIPAQPSAPQFSPFNPVHPSLAQYIPVHPSSTQCIPAQSYCSCGGSQMKLPGKWGDPLGSGRSSPTPAPERSLPARISPNTSLPQARGGPSPALHGTTSPSPLLVTGRKTFSRIFLASPNSTGLFF